MGPDFMNGSLPHLHQLWIGHLVCLGHTTNQATMTGTAILINSQILFYRPIVTNRAIKLSSPKLSNITAVGCILVYAAVVLLGLDYSTLPANDKAFPAVCTVSTLAFHLQNWLTVVALQTKSSFDALRINQPKRWQELFHQTQFHSMEQLNECASTHIWMSLKYSLRTESNVMNE